MAADVRLHRMRLVAATADGSDLVIIERTGAAFTIGNSAVTDAGTATTTEVLFEGSIVQGETWTLTIETEAIPVVINFTTLPTVTTLPALATHFATAINGNPALVDFTAVAEGTTLLIVKRTAGSFATTLDVTPSASTAATVDPFSVVSAYTIALSGTPTAGEIWSVTIAGSMHRVTVGSPFSGGGVVDTIDEIAAELAAAIRGDSALAT